VPYAPRDAEFEPRQIRSETAMDAATKREVRVLVTIPTDDVWIGVQAASPVLAATKNV
jgi:hypothetical protein